MLDSAATLPDATPDASGDVPSKYVPPCTGKAQMGRMDCHIEPHELEGLDLAGVDALEFRRLQVERLRIMGFGRRQIAEKLGVPESTVRSDQKAISKGWRTKVPDTWREFLGREIVQMELVEAEAWAAWQRSVDQGTTVTHRAHKKGRLKKDKKGNDITPTAELNGASVKRTPGDPRFLELILKASARKAAMLGMDAPAVTQLTEGTDEHSVANRIRAVGLLHRLHQLATGGNVPERVGGSAIDTVGVVATDRSGGAGSESDVSAESGS